MKFWTTGTKHQPFLMMACHVRDGMAHFALLLTLCETIQRYFQEYSMCVKLPATLNVQLEYVFTLGAMHKVCGYHYFVTK